MSYKIFRTDTADSMIRRIILYVAENFGSETALAKLGNLERSIDMLAGNPYAGVAPSYNVLRRQGYLVLILEEDLVFYKVNDHEKIVTIYAVVDQRQDYLSIIRGL